MAFSCAQKMKPKTGQKRTVDKGRLNFRITPTLYEKLSAFCEDAGMKTVSEGAWFIINTAMQERDREMRRVAPPPALML